MEINTKLVLNTKFSNFMRIHLLNSTQLIFKYRNMWKSTYNN